MKKIKSKNVQNYVMNDIVWKVDLPRLLKEISECSKSTPYPVTFAILARVLGILTERAIEINDPALNIIMMNLGLYEGVHDELMSFSTNHPLLGNREWVKRREYEIK